MMGHASICTISLATYRRLWLLYLIERFHDACYGAARLQKVAFFSEVDRQQRPFPFRKAPFGPYSEELRETLEQLLSMQLVEAEAMGVEGNKYRSRLCERADCPHDRWLESVSSSAKAAIDIAVSTYGYMRQQDILDAGHQVRGFADAQFFDTILDTDMGPRVRVPLDEDECEDLAISLSPKFGRLIQGLSETDWVSDLDKVQLVDAG